MATDNPRTRPDYITALHAAHHIEDDVLKTFELKDRWSAMSEKERSSTRRRWTDIVLRDILISNGTLDIRDNMDPNMYRKLFELDNKKNFC